jgi:hypothetical protein
MPARGEKKINKDQRAEIVRRVLAGEKAKLLAEEFGVTRAYVSLLKFQTTDPARFKDVNITTRKLRLPELAELETVLKTTTPLDHGFRSVPRPEEWRVEHGFLLVEKLFNKKPSKRTVAEFMAPYLRKRQPFEYTRPTPPLPNHIDQLAPEFANDPDFVAYYLSPICAQIKQREYELALIDYDARFERTKQLEKAYEASVEVASAPAVITPATKRTGKHAKGKGSPFTRPKRRK